jgi:hypothetical protein
MMAERLAVRLDRERRKKLDKIAATRGASVSTLVRQWIDTNYEEIDRTERLRAARKPAQYEVEDVPAADETSCEIDDGGWVRRARAVERIAQCEIEDMPDPDTLSRQLDETYAVPDLY